MIFKNNRTKKNEPSNNPKVHSKEVQKKNFARTMARRLNVGLLCCSSKDVYNKKMIGCEKLDHEDIKTKFFVKTNLIHK